MLTLSCPRRPGIVHAITRVLFERDADITEHRQFDDAVRHRLSLRTASRAGRACTEAQLAEGPIIEQEVVRIDHTFDARALTTVGQDAEAPALSRAVRWHCQSRILLNGRSTVSSAERHLPVGRAGKTSRAGRA